MNSKEYYNKAYFGLEQSCPEMIDIDLLSSYLVSPVLDVGCGQGNMVKKVASKGFRVYGCDIFDKVTNFGDNFFFHDMEKKPTKIKFKSIYSIHVLEHVFDYVSFLKNVRESLEDGGVLFLAVPNSYSLISRIKFFLGNETVTMGVGEVGCIDKNKLEPHLRYFGAKSLAMILRLNGFKIRECFGTRNGRRHWLNTLAGQLNFVCEK